MFRKKGVRTILIEETVEIIAIRAVDPEFLLALAEEFKKRNILFAIAFMDVVKEPHQPDHLED